MRIGESGGSIQVFDEGISLTEALKSMDFTGTGVTVTEGADNVLTIDIPSGGAGSGTGWSGTVANVASLPAAADHNGEVYRVTTSTGLFWAQRKGFYGSNGSVWTRESNPSFTVLDDEMTIYDDADNTKGLQFQVSPIGTGQIRVFSPIDANMDWAAVVANSAKVTNATHTGDVTGSGALTIGNDKVLTAHILNANVTLAKMANMATASLLGRNTAATGVPEVLSAATARALLNVANGAIANLLEDTTPQLGGNLDLNQNSIALNPVPSSDHTWNGQVITATAAEGVVIGDVCYLNSAGKFAKIDADAEATSKGLCAMATGTIATDATGVFLLDGFIRDDTWTWTIGAELFASTTPGNPTATAPSATLDIVRSMGYAYSADIIRFKPSNTFIEIV